MPHICFKFSYGKISLGTPYWNISTYTLDSLKAGGGGMCWSDNVMAGVRSIMFIAVYTGHRNNDLAEYLLISFLCVCVEHFWVYI